MTPCQVAIRASVCGSRDQPEQFLGRLLRAFGFTSGDSQSRTHLSDENARRERRLESLARQFLVQCLVLWGPEDVGEVASWTAPLS